MITLLSMLLIVVALFALWGEWLVEMLKEL